MLVTKVVNGQDVGMGEGGGRFGLGFESRQGFDVSREMLGKDLNGNGTVEARVDCAIDFAHTASAQPCLDTVVAEGEPDHPVAAVGGKGPGRDLERRPVQQHGCLGLIAEQRFQFAPQFFIIAAGVRQKATALIGTQVPGGVV